MAYIQTTKRLIHVKEGLQKLKNVLTKWRIDNLHWVGVTEVIPEIDIQLKRDEFYAISDNLRGTYTNEEIEYKWNKERERIERQNKKNSKGRKILIRVKDIMELHDER